MKAVRWFFPLLLGLLVVAPIRAEDIQQGFSNLQWGVDIAQTTGMEVVGGTGEIAYCVRQNDNRSIDGVTYSRIIYGFYRGRFFAAFCLIDSPVLFAQVRSGLQSRFGIPKVVYGSQGQPSIYRWKSGQIKIKLKENEWTGKMKIAYYYSPLSDQVNEAREERYREKSVD